ncbi:MAG: LapA family protein [Deltaproteobacteria bacterium]|nr:LapA family protein [Deltaproteobacteria bacterium]MBI3294339.1 LapA family protein [Deltaproteobacteria bacterium]
MKALKIIPIFIILIGSTYIGMLFVEANRTEVVINFGHYQSPGTALGFVVLTSVLIGMCVAGCLCSIEIFALYMQYNKIKRQSRDSVNDA